MKTQLVLLGLVLFASVLSVSARKKFARAHGRILCYINGRAYPVEYAKVSLLDKDPIGYDTFGTTRTNGHGYLVVSGRAGDIFGNPEPYIQVEYKYSGVFGKMEVENGIGYNRRDKTSTKGYSSSLSFGNIYFSNDHCKAYVNTLSAMKNFHYRTGQSLPYKVLKVVTRAILHGGTPYATTNKIRIPRGYNYNWRTARHKFAHTIRHTLDGTFAHFLGDVIRYRYMQHHNCRKRTNRGFAFNEGWAEFWAGSCLGSSSTDYRIEGNVASALQRLMRRCRSSYGRMVNVLRWNEGRIHSYPQYAAAHKRLYQCM